MIRKIFSAVVLVLCVSISTHRGLEAATLRAESTVEEPWIINQDAIFEELEQMQREMSQMLRRFHKMQTDFYQDQRHWGFDVPGQENLWDMQNHMDMIEEADRYLLSVALPGMDKTEISIEVQDGFLIIQGQGSTDAASQAPNSQVIRRGTSQFSRQTIIPKDVDQDNISADYKDGLLTVILPKIAPVPGRQIPIL